MIRDFLLELLTPSPREETLYTWVVIAMAHALLGMGLADAAAMLGIEPITALGGVVAVYVFGKELGDLFRNGRFLDSVLDTLFVTLGLAYTWFHHPHATILGIILLAAGGRALAVKKITG